MTDLDITGGSPDAVPGAAVAVQDLTKIFRDFWKRPKVKAVDGLDLNVQPGEIFGLLGPNGSGKSTTIKILLGLLHPTSGSVRVLGEPPHKVRTKAQIGYLPEESYLYRYLSARETLDFFGKLFELGPRERAARIEQLLDMVGLAQAADRPVGEFSKGMARRIGLAQALINDPALIILDEPTAGLDPIGCRQIKDLMLTLARRGKTVILSSHLLADVEDVCDRVVILYNGTVRARGRVKDMLEQAHRVRLTLPSLEPPALREVIRLLKERLGTEPDVDRPSIDLEQFFLQVVEEAHQHAAADTGANRNTPIAEFLADRRHAPQPNGDE